MFLTDEEHQMCERAAQHVPAPADWQRAGGDVCCAVCGKKYFDHPNAVPHVWLRVLCDGRFVKL